MEEKINQQNINEAVEEALEKAETSFWKKLQTGLMMLAALVISAGQWNDSMEVASNLWHLSMANFTHELEYNKINAINVGNSLSYIQKRLGDPQVIKHSKVDPIITFYYYTEAKFDLTIMTDGSRVAGYAVYTKQQGFTPKVPFSKALGFTTLANQSKYYSDYKFDAHNLFYYIEKQEMEQEGFLNLVQGYVEYAAHPYEGVKKDLNQLLSVLDEKATFSESENDITPVVEAIRNKVKPNFFAISELPSKIIAESLLTRAEYNMYTNS